MLWTLALAADREAVHAELADPGGWEVLADEDGVEVARKPIGALSATAWQGTMILADDADPDRMLAIIADVGNHEAFSKSLSESTVLAVEGSLTTYVQVMSAPFIADRAWISQGEIVQDASGQRMRRWSSAPMDSYADARAAAEERHGDLVWLPYTYGQWQFTPLGDGRTQVAYRTVADPGGAIPGPLFEAVTRRSLPENLRAFEDRARR